MVTTWFVVQVHRRHFVNLRESLHAKASIVVSGMHQMSLFILMLLSVFWVSWLVLLWDHGLGMPLSPEDRELGGASIWLLSLAVFAGGLGCLSDLTYWSLGNAKSRGVGSLDAVFQTSSA